MNQDQGIKPGDRLKIVSSIYGYKEITREAVKHYGKCTYEIHGTWYVWTWSGETFQQFEIGIEANKI